MSIRMLLSLVVVLGLTASALPAVENVYRDNVMIVLDGSGSMSERMRDGTTRIAAAKRAITTVLNSTPPETAIGLVAFSSGSVVTLGEIGADRKRLSNAVRGLRETGGTPLGKALKTAADGLLRTRSSQLGYGTYTLLVVTDGEASDAAMMNVFAPEIVNRGIRLDVIGVDMKGDHTLRAYAHRYRSADDTASLSEAVASTFAEVGGDDGDAGSEDFRLISEVFSSESAAATLASLGTREDAPIGSIRRPKTPAPVAPTPTTVQASQPAPTPSAGSDKDGGFRFFPIALGIIIAIVVMGARSRSRS